MLHRWYSQHEFLRHQSDVFLWWHAKVELWQHTGLFNCVCCQHMWSKSLLHIVYNAFIVLVLCIPPKSKKITPSLLAILFESAVNGLQVSWMYLTHLLHLSLCWNICCHITKFKYITSEWLFYLLPFIRLSRSYIYECNINWISKKTHNTSVNYTDDHVVGCNTVCVFSMNVYCAVPPDIFGSCL
jgi:hypothetical protein